MTASKLKLLTTADKKHSLISLRTRSMKTKIANGRHIAAGAIVTSQITANNLPSVDSVNRRGRSKFV